MTKHALLIAEKPSLMRAIQDAVRVHGFADKVTYKAFAGHTMSLKMPEDYRPEWGRMKTTIKDLPMLPSPFEYQPTDDKKDLYKDLKKECLSGKYDYVINACDAGREGQHIFWSFYDTIGAPLPVKRLWSSDTTAESLGKAMNALRDPSEPRLAHMTQASKLRAQFDWLIGMNASRAFSERARAGIAVGRVMTPTLKLVVDRELEIKNFKPDTFYEIEATFDGYTGKYFEPENKGRFSSKKDADAFIKGLDRKGTVKKVDKRRVTSKAPELFSLQSLQSEAGKRFGYTMKETLSIAQGLYDDGFLSYPRTDSAYVTKNTASTFPVLLKTVSHIDELSDIAKKAMADASTMAKVQSDGKYVNDKKVEDHDAILPTKEVPTRTLSKKEQNIYDLVARRFLALFMPPLIVEKTRIITGIDKHDFVTNGSVLVQKGFSELYGYNPSDQVLPAVSEKETRNVTNVALQTGKTTPPKRYTSSSLGDAMAAAGRFSDSKTMKEILKEAKGIGTPATRGDMVEKLVTRGWMEYKGKAKTIYATDVGISIIQALGTHDLVSVDLTAEWEDKLRNIEKGKLTESAFEKDMHDYINRTIRGIEAMTLSVLSTKSKGSVGNPVGECPLCKSPVIIGKKVYFCEQYNPEDKAKSCAFVMGKTISGAKMTETDIKKLLSGKKTKTMTFTTKSKKKYKAKLFWNKTKNALDREFVNDFEAKATKKKTDGGKTIKEDKFYWKTDKYKVGKDVWGHKVSVKQAQQLFDGEVIGPFTFTWRNGKTGEAKLSLDKTTNKTKFHFN